MTQFMGNCKRSAQTIFLHDCARRRTAHGAQFCQSQSVARYVFHIVSANLLAKVIIMITLCYLYRLINEITQKSLCVCCKYVHIHINVARALFLTQLTPPNGVFRRP